MIVALIGIGSCSEPPEPIESPFNPLTQVVPGTKSRMECPKCHYTSECKEGGMNPIICPECQAEMDIVFCPFGK